MRGTALFLALLLVHVYHYLIWAVAPITHPPPLFTIERA